MSKSISKRVNSKKNVQKGGVVVCPSLFDGETNEFVRWLSVTLNNQELSLDEFKREAAEYKRKNTKFNGINL